MTITNSTAKILSSILSSILTVLKAPQIGLIDYSQINNSTTLLCNMVYIHNLAANNTKQYIFFN